MSLHWFDIGAGVFLVTSIIFSGVRGFLKDIFSVLAWIFGYFGSIYFHPLASPFAKVAIKTTLIADLVTFFFLFASIYIAVRLTGVLFEKKLGLEKLPSEIDHGAGAILGVAKWAFFLAIFLSPLNHFPGLKKELSEQSIAAALILSTTRQISVPGGELDLSETVKNAVQKTRQGTSNGPDPALSTIREHQRNIPYPAVSDIGGAEGDAPVNGGEGAAKANVRVKVVDPVIKKTSTTKGGGVENGEDSNKMDELVGSFGG